uniref:ribonuclease H n=1 Tax=Pogona vitticeps TaxID=103695 RepID=A0ABM5F7S0_9SAUR
MPLTRSQMAEMSEVKDPQIDQGSEDEFGSVQGDSTGEQNPELRKILIVQQHELRMRQFEMEEREREERLEREKIALEKERMAFELRRLELMNQNNNNNRDSEGGQLSKADLKKFPVYHKGDCPEVFFSLVERAFVDFSVRETEKMTIMRSLISGSLAEVYAEMPEELMKDFAEFKKLVFARHGINAEQLRQRFRSLTKKPEQTFTQVGAQLVRLLEKWLSQEGTETYEQLKDLIALEQFYSVLQGELKFQVRERKPKSVAAAAEIADFISQIRKPLGEGKSVGKPKETYSKYSQGPGKSHQGGGAHGEGKPSDMKLRPQILEGKPKQDERESKYTRKCYFCQGKGHLISECEKLKQLKGMVPQNASGTKPKAVFCVQKEQGSVSLREPVAMTTQSGTATSADQAEENGPLVEVKRCLLVKTDSQLFETAGVDVGILDRQYRGLRDTCSQVTLCHPDIIPREFIIPNESMKVAGIEGQVISLPVAEVPVNFQGWRGDWRLAISSTLPAAVLVGNDLAEHVKRVLVITRSQATTGTVQGGNDEPETEAEGSSEAVVETLTTDSRFGQEQKADATLQKCFEQVTDAQLTPETPVRFLEKKGILYRETLRNISKGGDGIRSQLVVPGKYRPMILQRGHSDMFAAHLGVKGPLDLIKQNWEQITQDDPQDVVTFIDTLMNDLKRNLELAAESLQAQKVRQKTWYDHKARERHFDPGEEVLWLRPCRENKLQLKWAGPYRVISKMSDLTYLIEQEENQARRVVHVNALKPYYRGEQRVLFAIKAAESEEAELPFWEGRGEVKYNPEEVKISPALTQDQQQELKMLLSKYQQVFSNKPGIVKGVMHRIHTGDAPPQAVSPYRVTGPYRDKVRKELDEMLRENIIVPSSSPWSSPIVLVDKPDGSIRFCVDYRKLNRVTTPDAYPMPRLDNLIETIGGCRFISSLDLVKGYWQLRIDPRDQEKTAFCSPFGLYEFRVLSFGLRNAPATFQRLMDQTLAGLSDFTVAYIDDIGIFSNTWEDHLIHLELVLQRLSAAGLTVKASKCQLGSPEIKYLGHMVGGGMIKPLEAKIEAVRDWPRPNTKKKVKSFLGLVGYYRKFIPRFSEIAAPLTDLTRKKADDRIPWTSDCEAAFQRLKEALIDYPVLRAPDFDREFIIYTDASNSGVGAVLCQEDENGDQHPVSYLSRKLQKGL